MSRWRPTTDAKLGVGESTLAIFSPNSPKRILSFHNKSSTTIQEGRTTLTIYRSNSAKSCESSNRTRVGKKSPREKNDSSNERGPCESFRLVSRLLHQQSNEKGDVERKTHPPTNVSHRTRFDARRAFFQPRSFTSRNASFE